MQTSISGKWLLLFLQFQSSLWCGLASWAGNDISADAWRAFFILYSRVEDGVSPALQERFAEITLSIHYIRWRHLGNMYYKWGNNGPKLSARIVKVLSYSRNLWTSSSNHPAGPLIVKMNVFHLNQYSWVLLEPHNLVDFFFFNISDVFLFLFFSVFICLFFFFCFKLLIECLYLFPFKFLPESNSVFQLVGI